MRDVIGKALANSVPSTGTPPTYYLVIYCLFQLCPAPTTPTTTTTTRSDTTNWIKCRAAWQNPPWVRQINKKWSSVRDVIVKEKEVYKMSKTTHGSVDDDDEALWNDWSTAATWRNPCSWGSSQDLLKKTINRDKANNAHDHSSKSRYYITVAGAYPVAVSLYVPNVVVVVASSRTAG